MGWKGLKSSALLDLHVGDLNSGCHFTTRQNYLVRSRYRITAGVNGGRFAPDGLVVHDDLSLQNGDHICLLKASSPRLQIDKFVFPTQHSSFFPFMICKRWLHPHTSLQRSIPAVANLHAPVGSISSFLFRFPLRPPPAFPPCEPRPAVSQPSSK